MPPLLQVLNIGEALGVVGGPVGMAVGAVGGTLLGAGIGLGTTIYQDVTGKMDNELLVRAQAAGSAAINVNTANQKPEATDTAEGDSIILLVLR